MSRKTKEAVQGVIYILPSFVLILIFCIVPIFMSGFFSFTDYNIMNAPEFVGLDNYKKCSRIPMSETQPKIHCCM